MIEYLKGEITFIEPTSIVVECAQIGYRASISLRCYDALKDKKEVKLLVTKILRENEELLYGFFSEDERRIFLELIAVNGVGPNTARLILSAYTPVELASIISMGQTDALKAVKGIGLKTAQRILVDLKGKVVLSEEVGATGKNSGDIAPLSSQKEAIEAIEGLKALGYHEAEARKVVNKLLKDSSSMKSSEIIRKSLRLL